MVCVFARKTSEPLASLVKQIDRKIGENSKLKSFVVLITDQGDRAKEDLQKLAADAAVQHVPLTMYQEITGPPNYELAKDAGMTVLMWKRSEIKVNRAFKDLPTTKDIDAVVADISKILD
ncbi:MAG: hypothetical protein U0790_13600 [Isosphaeraceae bacterium]